jgi:hypothetical protein
MQKQTDIQFHSTHDNAGAKSGKIVMDVTVILFVLYENTSIRHSKLEICFDTGLPFLQKDIEFRDIVYTMISTFP